MEIKVLKTKFTTLISTLRIICPPHATELLIHIILSCGIRQWNFCRPYKRVISQNGFVLLKVSVGIDVSEALM
jgi:hypothetical protein